VVENLPARFSQWLGILQGLSGASQLKLSKAIGISQGQVSRLLAAREGGVGADVSLSSLETVADHLALRPWQLVRYVELGEVPEELVKTVRA